MFGLDLRTLRIVWTVFLFSLIAVLLYMIGSTVVVFTLAVFLAHLLGPMAERVEKMIPDEWVSRNLSLAVVYLVMILAIVAALIPVISQVGQQAVALAGQLPSSLDEDPLTKLKLPAWLEPLRDKLTGTLRDRLDDFDEKLIPFLQDVGSNIAGFLGSALAFALIPILSFFFLQDSRDIHAAVVDLVPGEHRDLAEDILSDLHHLLVEYIQALVVLALIVLAVYSGFLYFTGVPYPILLSALAALLEVIPIAGPLVSAIIILIVALLTGYAHIAWLIIFLVVFRLIQDYVISPHLMAAGVEIHPLAVLFGVLAGEQIAGIPGMFFSVPLIAALRIIVVRIRRQKVDVESSVLLE
ncbi:MAG: AI-2E family transporter [Bryobacteraceae bacterium]